MKLLNKISLYYIFNTAMLLIVGLFAIYISVNWIISDRTDGQLRDTSKEVALKLSKGIKTEYPPLVEIKELTRENKIKSVFKDTTIYLEADKEKEEFREYVVFRKINDKYYRIIIRSSLIEKEDLFSAILIIFSIIITLLLLILSLINRFTTRKIFKPFYTNLKRLEMFSLHKNAPLILETSGIDEFNEQKNALIKLSEKALKEFRSLKEFSEDLSHELQTPVAVIKAKSELLLQNEFADTEIVENLQSIMNNADRLDKLNRSLIILTKLETTDIFPVQKILLRDRIERILDNHSDAISLKNIVLHTCLESKYELEFNEVLMDILLNNLIANSIKHNFAAGEIFIELKNSVLIIKNSGNEPKQNLSNYFNRFTYDEKSKNSLGLGLAIVKKICDLFKIHIEYTFDKPYHIIKVNFALPQ